MTETTGSCPHAPVQETLSVKRNAVLLFRKKRLIIGPREKLCKNTGEGQ